MITVENARRELREIARSSPGSHMHKEAIDALDKARMEAKEE